MYLSESYKSRLRELSGISEGIFETDNSVKPYEKLYINSIVEFMKSKLGFEASISVRKKQNAKFFGDISLNNNSVKNHKFTVHFNPNATFYTIITSLIHELTHVKQVVKGELKPAEDYKSIIWNDDYVLTVREYNKAMKNFKTYSELPWEAEAYANMKPMHDEFISSKYWLDLKGRDANLDFIIDNI